MKRLHHSVPPHRGATLLRGLLVTLLVCLGPRGSASGQDDDYKRVFQQGVEAIIRGRFDESITAFERALELVPRSADSAYNLACAYALKREQDAAAGWLHKAVAWGYDDLDHLEQDPDLDHLRNHPRYQALVAQLRVRLRQGRGPAVTPALDQMLLDQTLDLIVMIRGTMEIAGTPTETYGAGILFGHEGNGTFIATANHVVRQAQEAHDLKVMLKTRPGQWLDAHLMPHFDDELDLAVLRLDDLQQQGLSFCALPLGRMENASTLSRGDAVYPVGYPATALWGMPVVPDRISQIIGDQISFQSTFIAKGHSGGALLTARGQVAGLLQAEEPPYGVALSVNRITEVLQQWNYPVQLRHTVPYARTALHTAVEHGDAAAVQRLLRDCADPNAADSMGWTPLHEAVANGSAEAVNLLIEAGADVYALTYAAPVEGAWTWSRDWTTPLHIAAEGNAAEIAQILMRHGVDPNTADKRENTPLHTAATNDFADMARVLLAGGADVHRPGYGRKTPLQQTAEHDAAAVARVLLEHGATLQDDSTLLHQAIGAGSLAVARLLLAHGADVNELGPWQRRPLHMAVDPAYTAEAISVEATRLLLDHGADVNATHEGRSPLFMALASDGRTEVVELLLEAGADIEIGRDGDFTLLHLAVAKGDVKAARLLLQAGTRVDELYDGYTPLYRAASLGQVEMVKLLLEAGADANTATPDPKNRTLLHEAVERGHAEVVKLLLEAGADIEVREYRDRTLLHIAAYEKQVEVMKVLLEAGIDVHARTDGSWNNRQETPLLIVSERGPVEAARLLLVAGARIDERDDRGDTPLHRAAGADWAEGVQLFLAAGAPIDARDNAGWTPLHEAARLCNMEALPMLVEAGANLEARTEKAQTPLHVAAAEGCSLTPEAVQALLDAGADARAIDSQGDTPLHLAAGKRNNKAPAVALLLRHGAAVNLRNEHGETPLSIALRTENYEIANLLRAHGAQE